MSRSMATAGPTLGSPARLGRALVFVHRQALATQNTVLRGELGTLIAAGQAVDFAVRLRGHKSALTPALALEFSTLAGIPHFRLLSEVLPRLKAADLIHYEVDAATATLRMIEEYVGLTARVIDQASAVLEKYGPNEVERALLHSTEIASWAPLTETQHIEQLLARGFREESVTHGVRLGLAAGVNQAVHSPQLGERVIFNPNVWGAEHTSVAGFLRTLPSSERDSLLGMCERASHNPGSTVDMFAGFDASVLRSARKVGLLQATTVRSSLAGATPQTYVFSPVEEALDDQLISTEALHERKLFVAHILYGHERAVAGRGRIYDPRILVDRLLTRGQVGPASNITTDYHLLEGYGIVAVRGSEIPGRSYLEAVKPDIIQGGLAWLESTLGDGEHGRQAPLGDLRPPSEWLTPEVDRAQFGDLGAAEEITTSAVLRLRAAREEAQRAARHDF